MKKFVSILAVAVLLVSCQSNAPKQVKAAGAVV